MPVRILSGENAETRDRIIEAVFASPHRFLTEDLAWALKTFGMSEADCRARFRDAPRLGLVEVDGLPVYLFAITPEGVVNTASHKSLDRLVLPMTKVSIRFARSAEGMEMLKGSVGYIELSDMEKGSVRSRWLEAIGYQRTGTIEAYGQTFIKHEYKKKG